MDTRYSEVTCDDWRRHSTWPILYHEYTQTGLEEGSQAALRGSWGENLLRSGELHSQVTCTIAVRLLYIMVSMVVPSAGSKQQCK